MTENQGAELLAAMANQAELLEALGILLGRLLRVGEMLVLLNVCLVFSSFSRRG